MQGIENALRFLDFVLNYFTLQLGRCAVFSVFLIALIMALRRICKDHTFLKGLLWSLLVTAPFIGRMKIFYENPFCVRVTAWWTFVCMGNLWISRLYFMGIAVTCFILINRRRRLTRFVKGMEEGRVADTKVYVCRQSITPFTTGVLFPKIAMPEIMLKEYREDELKIIVMHEKTHFRLGHLLFYLVWDALHVLLWVNPLFIWCLKYFKEDLEDICDRVTIQKIGSTGYEYGSLLLGCIKILQNSTEPPDVKPPFAFVGKEQYLQIKRRVKKVAGYKKYRRIAVCGMSGVAMLLVATLLISIKGQSYVRFQEQDNIFVYDVTGKNILIENCEELHEAISYDEYTLCIDTAKFRAILTDRNIAETNCTVAFGGYSKLPGYGGGGNSIFLEFDLPEQGTIQIPYVEATDIFTWMLKMI